MSLIKSDCRLHARPDRDADLAVRFAAVSDIHGNLPALEAVIADIDRRRDSDVVNLGDSLSGPLWSVETAQCLMALGWPSFAGNHERELLTLSNG